MRNSTRHKRLWVWARRRLGVKRDRLKPKRGAVDHVILLDGTNSTLRLGEETNIGLIYQMLASHGQASIYYEAGLQWEDVNSTLDVAIGRGINRQIARAYGYLAARYKPGDRIFLLGFSRGAFAVRSLAGLIDRVGLLQSQHATEREIRQIYRLYRCDPDGQAADHYRTNKCYEDVPIEMVGVFDTVKALGVRLPILWRFSQPAHEFHDLKLGRSVRNGFHALAMDETRLAFNPVLWDTRNVENMSDEPHIEQVWFKGCHGDVGGPPRSLEESRGLINIPLVWMLEKAEDCGLSLPNGWRMVFPCDPTALSVGAWRGWSKLFILRRKRIIGLDPSESRFEDVHRITAKPARGAAE